MINFFKQFAVGSLIITGLYALGFVVNSLVPWIWLTYFFVLLRTITRPLNFIWDFTAVFQVFAIALSFMVGIWSFRAVLAVRNFFSKE